MKCWLLIVFSGATIISGSPSLARKPARERGGGGGRVWLLSASVHGRHRNYALPSAIDTITSGLCMRSTFIPLG